jgi:ABC-type multidrug transport system ATPase subunit
MITLSNLTTEFGPQVAVDQLTLQIPDGQLVGLLGPNGAGKSTTIKMLTGMLLPSSWTAEINGSDVVTDPLNVKRIIGYVPETGAVFESLTAWEYLHLVAALYHIPETRRMNASNSSESFLISPLPPSRTSNYPLIRKACVRKSLSLQHCFTTHRWSFLMSH